MGLYLKISSAAAALTLYAGAAYAQQIDTAAFYSDREDTLQAAVFSGARAGNFLSKHNEIRTEVISAAGLCKMACCNLAESFENSASVTVGYSDAVTGARQIRLLGQSGIYTQMLDENRPVMRGLSAPFGLNYIPGQWLESIRIAKGVTSVINGVESMTGQIDMEHRKPTDEKPLYIQASAMNDTKMDLNVISALQLDEMMKWSTVILAHLDGNMKAMDQNDDGFMDDPGQLQMSLSNRWLYYGSDGTQVRFGVRAIHDRRRGGQMEDVSSNPWTSNVFNRSIGAYAKLGVPLDGGEGASSLAAVADWTYQDMDAGFGLTPYVASQHSAFLNLLWQNEINESNRFTIGASGMWDRYHETFLSLSGRRTDLCDLGLFGEYTFHSGDKFSAIAGLRADRYNLHGTRISPRLTLKYAPVEDLVLRFNGGRGLRYSTPIIDNLGVLSTSKALSGDYLTHALEDAWTFGANATWYLPFDASGKTYLSIDGFTTRFRDQMLVDYSATGIDFYTLSSLSTSQNPHSYTDNLQIDFSTEPIPGLTATLTGRLTDARQTLTWQDGDIKPMTSLYKGVLNLQYATHLNRWIFDFTASVNGPCRVWDFMKDLDINGRKLYAEGYTPVYPLLYAQITRRFKGFDLYAGGENLTGYTQPSPIISADDPWSGSFDASCIWGPLMGVKLYAGVRITVWKKG